MNRIINFVPPFLIAWLMTFSLASVFQSQTALSDLANAGMQLTLSDRIRLIVDDWVGLVPTYGAIIAMSTLLIFLVIGYVERRLKIEKNLTRAIFYGTASTLTIALVLFCELKRFVTLNVDFSFLTLVFEDFK